MVARAGNRPSRRQLIPKLSEFDGTPESFSKDPSSVVKHARRGADWDVSETCALRPPRLRAARDALLRRDVPDH
jgi:hypothetical protein